MQSLIPLAMVLSTVAAYAATDDQCERGSLTGSSCINVKLQASRGFTFPPLFTSSSPAKFVIASEEDEATSDGKGDPMDDWNRSGSFKGFWIEYDRIDLNSSKTPMVTELVVLLTENENEPGGGENGCVGLLGDACVKAMQDAIKGVALDKDAIIQYPLSVTDKFKKQPAELLAACPKDLFDKQVRIDTKGYWIGLKDAEYLAYEDPRKSTSVSFYHGSKAIPSGNSTHTWGSWSDDSPQDDPTAKAAIAVIARYPKTGRGDKTLPPRLNKTSDIETTMVCVKLSRDGATASSSQMSLGGRNASVNAALSGGLFFAWAAFWRWAFF